MATAAVLITKRAIDVVAAGVGLSATLPFYPLIAAAIKLDTPGPIFHSQIRAGMLLDPEPGQDPTSVNCVRFRMWKFRSMGVNAEKGTGAVVAAQNDVRVTRVGRILRKTRIDELPQLYNVLVGDMSLVGPRPERPEILSTLAMAIPFFEERMRNVKPGITGLAQISLGYTGRIPDDSKLAKFRDALTNPFDLEGAEDALADDMRSKLLFDLAYTASLEHFSTFLRTELEIILKTPLTMARGVGR